MNKYVESDLYRYSGRTDARAFLHTWRVNKAFRYQVCMRLCSARGLKGYLARVRMSLYRGGRIQIPYRTRIGYGLYIGHNGPVVVHESAVIGNNCNLSQFVTIGSNTGQAAEIGDNVYIGPSVCIVEHVKIGSNVTIGAGSVVTKDIPDNATAVGNYARCIHFDSPGRFIGNRYEKI